MRGTVETKAQARDLRVSLSFREFLPYVRIQEPPPGRNVIAMELWVHLLEVADLLAEHRLIEWLKARQLGASWLIAAYVDWRLQYQHGTRVGMVSQGQDEAQSLLAKVRFVHMHLPDDMRLPLGKDNTEQLTLPSAESQVLAYPSTADAGRGETFSLVVFDEADYHPNFEANYSALKPTIDDVGGQMIIASTSNHKTVNSTFKDIFKAAPGNGFRAIFYGWDARPNRGADWYEARKGEAHDVYLFEKENPRTSDEALAPATALMAFDKVALMAMEKDTREPIEQVGMGRIWHKYQVGKRYGAGTDTSHGVGGDDAVTVIVDLDTGAVVADLQSDSLNPELLAYESNTLLEQFRYPLWAIEDNEWGILTIKAARDLGYPQLYFREPAKVPTTGKGQVKDGVVGWHTDERSRYTLWGELMDAVRSRLVQVCSAEGLGQFWSVIRDPAKGGRIQAVEGAKDDYPMAVGIAWQMRKYATHRPGKSRGGRPMVLKRW